MNKKGFAHPALLIILLILIFLFVYFTLYSNLEDLILNKKIGLPTRSDGTKISQPANENSSVFTLKKNNDQIVKKEQDYLYDGEEKIIQIVNNYNFNFIKINNWLFYYDGYNIYARDLADKKIIKLIDEQEVKEKLNDDDYQVILTELNNDLIVTYNSYLQKGLIYKISGSNPQENIKFYLNSINNLPKLRYINGTYLLSTVFGDACAFSSTYQIFDYNKFEPEQNSITLGSMSNDPTWPIGFDGKKQEYLYSEYSLSDVNNMDNTCGIQTPFNLKATTFDGKITTYLDKDVFPKSVLRHAYSNKSREVYFLTNTNIYVYGLNNNELLDLGKHQFTKDELNLSFRETDEGRICLGKILISRLDEKIIEKDSKSCEEPINNENINTYLSSLDLPESYHIITMTQ